MKLNFKKISEDKTLVPKIVLENIEKYLDEENIYVAEIDPRFADGELLSKEYEIPLEKELNCLVVEGKRKEVSKYAMIVVPYGKKANTGGSVKKILDAQKVSFANLDYVIESTGMEFGSINPIGTLEDWYILVDSTVFQQKDIIIGGGLVKSKIMMSSEDLKKLPNFYIIDGLIKE